MISHRHKCIYVKIPKCAGTTVLDWFMAHAGGRHSLTPGWYGGLLSERIQKVAKAIELHPEYFTFSFVRNPYERFVSVYFYVQRRARVRAADIPGHPDGYGSLPEFAELCCEVLGDFRPRWGREAREFFLENGERRYGPRRIRLRHLGFVTGHARPQADYLPDCNPRRLFGVARANPDPLSFIGTVENFEADFARLARILDLPARELPNRNASGPHTGSERGRRYAGYYDDATRRLVERLYADDLEFTGCDFDRGGAGVPVLAPPRSRPGTRSAPPRTAGRMLARAWFDLCALEFGIETRIRRFAAARRLLRPLKRLRQGAIR